MAPTPQRAMLRGTGSADQRNRYVMLPAERAMWA